jgi:hypothetical protein
MCDTYAMPTRPQGLRIREDLLAWGKAAAERAGVTFNAWVNHLIENERARTVGRYRTKPGISIDAIPVPAFRSMDYDELPVWVQDAIRRNLIRVNGETVTVMTPDGDRLAWSDGWLLRGTEEEIYSITDSVFRRKYEPVNP